MGLEQDIREFMDDTEKICKQTGAPMMPLMFCHLCIYFSPLCVKAICASRRQSKLIELVNKYWTD